MQLHIVTQTVPRLVLGALLVLCPIAGYPLGLGKLQVKSALNEPLNAEIDITSIADNELKGLNVSLAPRADFDAAGAERLPLLSQIKFTVAKRPDGRYYLQLKTDAPIEEPFLHMLLQIEWTGGRLVREYTALVDPPSFMVSKPPAIEAPASAPETPVAEAEPPKFVETVPPPSQDTDKPAAQAAAPTPAPIPEPLPASEKAADASDKTEDKKVEAEKAEPSAPQPTETAAAPQQEPVKETIVATAPSEQPASQTETQPAAPVPAGDQSWANAVEYTVRPGDTLWAIADRVRTDKQLTVEQVIIAIFRNNRDAFFRDNANNLRAGKVLKMPERDEVEATPNSEALREFRAQYDAWQEYKMKLAGASSTLKVADSKPAAEPEKAAAPAAESKPTETKTATAKQSQELLKIVRGSVDAEKAAANKSAETESTKDVEKRERTALAERVTTLEESLQSKQLENRELADKVGQVRTQIKNEKRLIELESQALAQQTAKPAPKVEPAPAPAPKPEVKAEAPAPAPAPAATEPKKEAAPAAPATPVKTPRKPIAPPPQPAPEETSFIATLLDDVMSDSILPIVGGIVVVLAGGIVFVYMRRRRRSMAEFEESILASDAVASENTGATGTAETTGQVTTGDTSFLSDFSKSGMGQVHTDEVDPIAEAEVYLAYGRDETAEEILKEAIVKNPDRQELKHKLLEIYHQRNDVNAFETLAEELYAALGGRGGKIWEKVEEMGRKLNPDNPMFRGGAPGRRAADKAPAAAAAPRTAVMPAAMAAAGGGGMDIAATAATQVVENRGSIDFEFSAPAAPAAESSSEPSLDFDLEMTSDSGSGDKAAAQAPAASAEASLDSIDFGSPADNLVDFEPAKGGTQNASSDIGDLSAAEDEIKWDLDAPAAPSGGANGEAPASAEGNGADGHWDETATKLDLAKAYIDMGDAEGARSILDEVLAEGNEQQKKQAAELAAQIA